MSAAETFTQALMGRTPHVLRIGENTQGVFCDVLGRHLPNGWNFGLRRSGGATFVPMMEPAHLWDRDDPPGFWCLDGA
jgi:hypothetical protein